MIHHRDVLNGRRVHEPKPALIWAMKHLGIVREGEAPAEPLQFWDVYGVRKYFRHKIEILVPKYGGDPDMYYETLYQIHYEPITTRGTNGKNRIT